MTKKYTIQTFSTEASKLSTVVNYNAFCKVRDCSVLPDKKTKANPWMWLKGKYMLPVESVTWVHERTNKKSIGGAIANQGR